MKHTPAHTINVPDEYTDDKGVSYTVWPDVSTIDPRKDWWDDTNVGAHIFEPRIEQYFVGTVWVVESGDECICGLYADSMEEAIELFNENRG